MNILSSRSAQCVKNAYNYGGLHFPGMDTLTICSANNVRIFVQLQSWLNSGSLLTVKSPSGDRTLAFSSGFDPVDPRDSLAKYYTLYGAIRALYGDASTAEYVAKSYEGLGGQLPNSKMYLDDLWFSMSDIMKRRVIDACVGRAIEDLILAQPQLDLLS